jgi:hypothetical protein
MLRGGRLIELADEAFEVIAAPGGQMTGVIIIGTSDGVIALRRATPLVVAQEDTEAAYQALSTLVGQAEAVAGVDLGDLRVPFARALVRHGQAAGMPHAQETFQQVTLALASIAARDPFTQEAVLFTHNMHYAAGDCELGQTIGPFAAGCITIQAGLAFFLERAET